jgi:hypothetical protein
MVSLQERVFCSMRRNAVNSGGCCSRSDDGTVFTSQHKRERGDFVVLAKGAQVSCKRKAPNSDGCRDESSAARAGCCRCAASRKDVRCDSSQTATVPAKR